MIYSYTWVFICFTILVLNEANGKGLQGKNGPEFMLSTKKVNFHYPSYFLEIFAKFFR